MAPKTGRVFLFASIVVLTGVMLAGCSGGGSSQSGAVPQAPSAPDPSGLPRWPANDPNIPPLEDMRVTLPLSHPGPLTLLPSNGVFPTLDFDGRPPASTAGANDYEQVGVKIPTGGTYNGIYAEHTAYLPTDFVQTYSHGGNSYYAPYDAIEGPLVRPNNGGCLASGTFAGNTGSGVATYVGVLSWCVSEANATLGLMAIDSTFISNYVALNGDNLNVYKTQIFTTDNPVTSSSVWHWQIYNRLTSTWDEYTPSGGVAARTGKMQAPFGYTGYLAAHRSGQCPGGLPVQSADNVQLGVFTTLTSSTFSALAPSMTGLSTNVVSPTASMGCFNSDTTNPGSTGAATNLFTVINANNRWQINSITAPAPSCPDVQFSAVTILGYYPCDLASAYNLSDTGVIQGVAIVDAFNDPNAETDLATYRSTFGLPACTTANHCFAKVNQSGVQGSYPPNNTSWAGEISLDLDMISAVCPRCGIILVEANSTSSSDLGAAVNTAAGFRPEIISLSYGGAESPADLASNTAYYNQAPILLIASAGDNGYGVQYPASSPNVVAVGGTSLYQAGNARGWSETVWGYPNATPVSGTGSGCSAYETKPSWQTDVGCSNRMVADVSAVADPNTGVAIYDTYNASGWQVIGGTSASAPIIAGVYGLSGGALSATAAQGIYQNASALFDVTSGSNGTCSPAYLCTGAAGYDGPTGNGTPNGLCAFGGSCTGAIARKPQGSLGPHVRRVMSGPSEPLCGPAKPGEYRCFALRRTDIGSFGR